MGARLQNRYELGEPLEELEAGVWHRGEDVRARRAVRVALLTAGASEERVAAFERAVRLLAKVRHPGVERVLSSGNDDEGHPFVVVEHFQGIALGIRLHADPAVKLHDLLRSATSVLNGLDIAHKAGLVHGGIEPSRVLVDEKLRAQLVGFALHGASGATPSKDLVAWLAPEVLAGAAPTAASDVYGMGAILYRAFVGEPPKIGAGLSLRERRRVIPASLAEAVDKAVSVMPGDRPQTAGDFRKELTAAMVGAHGLRTMVVPRRVERADDTLETTEALTLADLEEPTPRELVAWTKSKISSPPPPPRDRSPGNQRALASSRPGPRAAAWKRSDPPPLPLPANTTSNERSYRPPAPARRAAAPSPTGAARAVQATPTPASPPRPAVAVARVKLVSAAVPRPASPRVVEVSDVEALVELEPITERVETPAAAPAAAPASTPEPAPVPMPTAAGPEPIAAGTTVTAAPLPADFKEDDEDDEPELEASDDDDDDDAPEEDAREHAWFESPPREVRPWPYPTGGPPGIAFPPRAAVPRSTGALPALAIGLFVIGIVLAGVGTWRVATSGDDSTGALAHEGTSDALRPRRRASGPRPTRAPAAFAQDRTPVTVTPAPPPSTPIAPAPVVAAPAPAPVAATPAPAPQAEPTPVGPDRLERRPTARRRTRPSAPSSVAAPSMAPAMAPTMSSGRTLVRDPGF